MSVPAPRLCRALSLPILSLALAFASPASTLAQTTPAAAGGVLNLYSARHYQTDEALYENFTKATGIRINRIDADDAGLLARLKSEGRSSPADVILLVDAARLWRGEIDGLFQPVRSAVLNQRVPAHLRGKDDGSGSRWFGLSTRARVIVIDKTRVTRGEVDSYAKLADPRHKGKVCTRSGAHPYNLSLFGALMEHWGPARTEAWLTGVVANMARPPKGGDTDQLRALVTGECAIALSNTYYVARLLRSTKPEDKAWVERTEVIFPDQDGAGTHVNVAGGAVAAHAPNPSAAQRFLEYLVSAQAQAYFADGNNEWPVVADARITNPALDRWGNFKRENIAVSVVGMNQVKVQQMLDRVGYK